VRTWYIPGSHVSLGPGGLFTDFLTGATGQSEDENDDGEWGTDHCHRRWWH
jgi:hypothetical protein